MDHSARLSLQEGGSVNFTSFYTQLLMGEPWPILCDVQTSVMKLLGMNFPQPKMMHLVENIEEESPVIILQR